MGLFLPKCIYYKLHVCVPIFLNNTVSVLSEYNETLLRFRPKNEKRPNSTKKALEVRIKVKIEHWSLYLMFGTDSHPGKATLGAEKRRKISTWFKISKARELLVLLLYTVGSQYVWKKKENRMTSQMGLYPGD